MSSEEVLKEFIDEGHDSVVVVASSGDGGSIRFSGTDEVEDGGLLLLNAVLMLSSAAMTDNRVSDVASGAQQLAEKSLEAEGLDGW